MSVANAIILLSNNERQQMTPVEHSLKFVTEFDETHPTAQRFLQLEAEQQIAMLEGMLKELLVSAIQPVIDTINENGSYAILKVAN
jgi:F0F1-type ATP synthase delta subunit